MFLYLPSRPRVHHCSRPLRMHSSTTVLLFHSRCSVPLGRTLASFCFLTLQNLLVPNGVANVISPDCSLLNKKHRTKCTKLTGLHTKAFQVSCTDVCIAVLAKLYGFWVSSIFHTNLAFRFCTFYIFGKSSVVCPLFVVGMKEKKEKYIRHWKTI